MRNSRIRKRRRRSLLQNLHIGETIGYNEDLGSRPEVSSGKIKQRVYDDPREFLGNYKTVLGKGGGIAKGHRRRLGRRSGIGAFFFRAIVGRVPKSASKLDMGEIKDLTKPGVRMLVDATQWGASQHIRLAMQPTGPSLVDCL